MKAEPIPHFADPDTAVEQVTEILLRGRRTLLCSPPTAQAINLIGPILRAIVEHGRTVHLLSPGSSISVTDHVAATRQVAVIYNARRAAPYDPARAFGRAGGLLVHVDGIDLPSGSHALGAGGRPKPPRFELTIALRMDASR